MRPFCLDSWFLEKSPWIPDIAMGMDELESIYDREFFRLWGRENKAYVESARQIAQELYTQHSPKRIIDLGCGCGVYGYFFQQMGVEVVFLDGVVPPEPYAFPVHIQVRDLTEPFENIWGDFDFALCLDVGEHIPEDLSDIFLANLTNLSDTVIMACAPPGQGGQHHVNEQPKRYWIKRMSENGFAYKRPSTGVLCEAFKLIRPPLMWMWEHISVYERTRGSKRQGGRSNAKQVS